jgi:hypothetical protein
MRYIHSVCLALALVGLAAGPGFAAPRLSLHAPTLSSPARHAPAAPAPGELLLAPGVLMGAIKVKDTAATAAKFKRNASAATQDYTAGVQGAGADWEAGARAGESNYEQGVQDAISRKAFGKGIATAGSTKYTENATKLGAQRYPTGIAQAEATYARAVQPFLDTIKGVSLPPRGPKGSPQNQQRADAVAKALRMAKVGR